jgi:cell division protein ZapA (FtsZ GTPase activity inhibitor)
MAGVESGVIEQRKAALQRQGQELDRRLVEIDRQGQQLQQERGQVIANLNAVSGALQLCEDLLKTTADSRQPAAEPGLTLEQLKERIGADSVEVVEGEDGRPPTVD